MKLTNNQLHLDVVFLFIFDICLHVNGCLLLSSSKETKDFLKIFLELILAIILKVFLDFTFTVSYLRFSFWLFSLM